MLHILNHNRDHSKPGPVVGAIIPILKSGKRDDGLVVEKEGEEEEEKKNPFDFLRVLDPKRGKKKVKPIDPHMLPRALFTLGVSLINVNVRSCGDVDGLMNMFTFIPPLRHALYANAISDGALNFVVGIIYASYMQIRDFGTGVKDGEVSKFELLGAIFGLFLQSNIYCLYGIFMVPVIFVKLSTINKNKNK
ncbi:hypothetical protein DSO57_1034893 [Entomophthora muscae]|uniref:Uncharacterized protein n=1 Tax=Entomophthora muscae TaxID=34485 RepID=A0ACC2SD70_9FUNG|nr:hypothetical protein DSO57_1034893 [Entomophthora muscae]